MSVSTRLTAIILDRLMILAFTATANVTLLAPGFLQFPFLFLNKPLDNGLDFLVFSSSVGRLRKLECRFAQVIRTESSVRQETLSTSY